MDDCHCNRVQQRALCMVAEATTSAGGTPMKCAGAMKSRKEHSFWDTWPGKLTFYCTVNMNATSD